jgi:hypothetical protein
MEINQEQETTIEAQIVDTDFSPLDAPVKKRAYTSHILASDDAVLEDLAEPTFQTPTFSDFDPEQEKGSKEPDRPFNESYSELDNKDKTMGAEMMADMTLDLYEKGCGFLGKYAEISERKLDTLIAEGEIDPNIQIPTESGNLLVKEFAQEFNSSIKDAFEVSDEFKENIRPPLIRVLKKRGIGMTDEQMIGYLVVTDLGAKFAQTYMLNKTGNSIVDSLKENTQMMRETQAPRPAPAPVQKEAEPIKYYEEAEEERVVVKRKKPKTNLEEQIEFFEPEEAGSVFNNLKDSGGFSQDYREADNMPKFGDREILSQLEKLSEEPTKPVRKSTTGAKRGRKPKAK